ncbi:MAG: hypothetical protein A3B17_01335 [Candidatus Yanofskybacteria bacterium RIFCSPLOWO2_01_FULL_45_72]|uniref:Uncharacterized protein n=1 Tax=Candidatus Yanofskybacteria bacterium RIFCSPLOWO2_02_FULL_45_18 TaxID=1802707 RepID=A0A1F8H2Z9_9BACT|nr:MAG: hypothetical protein A3B17_01335 [Candidatus Yanofskybacteria bacterium RIFCSPLOWO2_01_FULL_45_72]OGN32002.1 MAG: hypothetical protein A3J01_02915 [Candidatus Yanofskybacteria bacterium RIFCSPLOWO2_02_FULL_45_18]
MMPAFSKEKEKEFLAVIRLLLVRRPDISILGLQEALNQNGYRFHREYVTKLQKKVLTERIHRIEDRQLLSKEIAEFEDLIGVTANELWRIILAKNSSNHEKIRAIGTLVNNRSVLLEKKFNAGVFEKQLGKVKAEPVLTPEQRQMVSNALDYVHSLSLQNQGS